MKQRKKTKEELRALVAYFGNHAGAAADAAKASRSQTREALAAWRAAKKKLEGART